MLHASLGCRSSGDESEMWGFGAGITRCIDMGLTGALDCVKGAVCGLGH